MASIAISLWGVKLIYSFDLLHHILLFIPDRSKIARKTETFFTFADTTTVIKIGVAVLQKVVYHGRQLSRKEI